ncbi:hypothetical protein A2Y85_02245 [candidate division WOR-3 bacterium RBG_13_43_14]|uniref:NADH:ubiquinone oxidoreductase, Na translocating, B subunit n=1 Tax=candidate division WOR-3 bacterium RBG_13_43_14 TaxID=1802590 RepID=A0A1F4UDG0_UNCW3|nr:MAG: hypothetical protein A2Y85_02245 [candidate division WOR-3 bacterium RBG_13_43_14]
MTKTKRILVKQPLMRRVIIACIPCIISSIYFFGWRSLVVIIVACVSAFLTEFFFEKKKGEPVSEAVFVSAIIYSLILPPTIAWHVLIIGIVFAILFGKMVFGGFGHNIFNPAMVGRAFVYICFPVALTATWAPPAGGLLGGFSLWSTAVPDALTSATPMAMLKAGTIPSPSLLDLFLGNIAGSMGVTSVLAILIGGFYLVITKTANRWIILTLVLTYAISNGILAVLGIEPVPGMLVALMGGGFLFGAFFMATDPISAPRLLPSQIIYAIIIGISTLVIRNFSVFNGGLMFSILLGNMFAPILDYYFKNRAKKAVVKESIS